MGCNSSKVHDEGQKENPKPIKDEPENDTKKTEEHKKAAKNDEGHMETEKKIDEPVNVNEMIEEPKKNDDKIVVNTEKSNEPIVHDDPQENIADLIWQGDFSRIQTLVNSNNELIHQAEQGTMITPLHVAAESGNVEITTFLLDKGAKIDAVSGVIIVFF